MTRISVYVWCPIFLASLLGGCQEAKVGQPSQAMAALSVACTKGNLQACATVAQLEADERAASRERAARFGAAMQHMGDSMRASAESSTNAYWAPQRRQTRITCQSYGVPNPYFPPQTTCTSN